METIKLIKRNLIAMNSLLLNKKALSTKTSVWQYGGRMASIGCLCKAQTRSSPERLC